ncbi:hypothetical protein Cni_G22827 [Canna indica]|uniref:Uncharacterized protein n=1 Tax=Canna indica TaxID=4628 RepID=A0AAQ3KUX1_9LILI|nr:hypothetical protein Cni_G22827 [Canna indica]
MEGSEEDAKLRHPSGDDDEPSSRPPPPPPPQRPAAQPAIRRNWLRDPLHIIALLFFSANIVVSAYRSRRDPSNLAFILTAYFVVLSLFFCLRRFERGGSPEEKARTKAAIWLLATALIVGFSWRMSKVMPWGLTALIWILAGSVTVGGFHSLFLYKAS